MARDEFPVAARRYLAGRVCHRCSNPDCRQPTAGPRHDSNKATNIGVAAHISAASPGGPRYDPKQTPAERMDIDNGIWLCQNCARLVDNDEYRFTVETLRLWKQQAEQAARLALQRQSRSESELDLFCRLSSKMPTLIEEMATDLHASRDRLIREFVVLPTPKASFNHDRPRFEYYETTHPEAKNAIALLEEYGFIVDVTPRNYPIYRMTEPFVDLVMALYPSSESS